MNIVNKLTVRHMKLNRRRTLVTIIGVIISAAMIMAVATIIVSFLDLLKRQTIAESGEWHVLYRNIGKEQLEAIRRDRATRTLIVSRDEGYAELAGSKTPHKPYLFIKAYNSEGFRYFPVELSEGRLPRTEDELAVSESIAKNAGVDYQIGDTLTLDVGQRYLPEDSGMDLSRNGSFNQTDALFVDEKGDRIEELRNTERKTYTVVGIIKTPSWEPVWSPGYTALTYLDEKSLGPEDRVNGSVILRKVNNALHDHAKALAKQWGMAEPVFNSELLRYYGVTDNSGLKRTLYSVSGVLMAVIVVGSVSLIYNAFAISVSERSRHLGMLASVGATRRQKRNSVFFEGAVIGMISIPLGIVCGIAGIGVTFLFINKMIQGAFGITETLQVTVTPMSVATACGVSLLTIFISTYLPARRASRISAIDAIRQTADIKLTRRAVKTSKLVRILFGIEAEIGLKNLKRNKRRYMATVFSLVISIVLFLTVSYFTDMLKKSVEMSQVNLNYDLKIWTGAQEDLDDSFVRAVAALDEVTEYSVMKEADLFAWIDESQLSDPLRKQAAENPDLLDNGKMRYQIMLHGLDDDSLRAYAERVGADFERMRDAERPAAIVVDTVTYLDKEKYVETKAIRAAAGSSLDLHGMEWETVTEKPAGTVEIAALTDQPPLGVTTDNLYILHLIVSERAMDRLLAPVLDEGINLSSGMALQSSDPMKTQQDIEEMDVPGIHLMNVYQHRQQEQQVILIVSVFTYGFILLITAISIANIFNTISTSIALRKREFAMLKSVGMTPKSFNKMINYESVFYGIKALLYGLPASLAVMALIHRSSNYSFSYRFELPWTSMLFAVIAVFAIVGSAMLYSSSKVKKENIIDAIKQESI